MAYSRRKTASRSRARVRSTSSRTNYRSRSVRRPARRRATGGTRSPRQQVIRIELVGAGETLARPMIGQKPAAAPRKAMF